MGQAINDRETAQVSADALALLNPWQRGFPLCARPFEVLAQALGRSETAVIERLAQLRQGGSISRIGGVFHGDAGGAALLSALAVPAERLEAVAAQVSAHPGVNHNYEREGRYNLWFVMTGCDAASVEQAMQGIEAETGLTALRLPMQRAYRIDLGFDLRQGACVDDHGCARRGPPPSRIDPADEALAALAEEGLPLVPQPYRVWAERLGRSEADVLQTLQAWQEGGQLRRFGIVVRHHELGFAANAMTVFQVPADRVDDCGEALARVPGVTLAYRRAPDRDWHYNLYCMVHGRDREAVHGLLQQARQHCGLQDVPHQVLFSRRRFKQTGARRFRSATV